MNYLREKYGNDGYAAWYILLEKLGHANHHYLDLSDKTAMMLVSSAIKVTETRLTEIIRDLVTLKAFDSDLWDNYQVLYSQEFSDSVADAYAKRSNEIFDYDSLRRLYPVKVPVNPVNSPVKPQRKEKKSKEEKNIYTEKFSLFWEIYPKRNGKKVGKQATWKKFQKLKLSDLDLIIKNAENYGVGNDYPKDPERFLKDDFWRDWDTPQKRKETADERTARLCREAGLS